jgi:hypothetical protein
MERIALQDLGHSERRQTYTAVSVCKERRNFMSKGEVYTMRNNVSNRTANLDVTGKENRKAVFIRETGEVTNPLKNGLFLGFFRDFNGFRCTFEFRDTGFYFVVL